MKDIFKTIIKHPFAICAILGAVTAGAVKIIEASAQEKEMITTDRAELEAILRKRQKEQT